MIFLPLKEHCRDFPPPQESSRSVLHDDAHVLLTSRCIAVSHRADTGVASLDCRKRSGRCCSGPWRSPYAPHIAEEIWEKTGGKETLAYEDWPTHDESLLVKDTVNLPVQVGGKVSRPPAGQLAGCTSSRTC